MKMRLLFAYDHRFLWGQGGVYTSGAFPKSAWDRYLEHFDEVRVIGRNGGPVPPGWNLERSDRPGVSIESLPNLSSFRQLVAPSTQVRARMREAVSWADAVVARLPSEIGLMAFREARRQGKAIAVEVVGCAWDGFRNHGSRVARIYAPLLFLRTRRAVKHAPIALYVTSQWLQDRYPTDGIRASASNVELFPLSREARAKREMRLKEILRGATPCLGTIATLTVKTKGVQTALEALGKLRASGLDLPYRVLGAGPKEPWQALAERFGVADLVTFDGTRPAGKGVSGWLDEIDVYLQPSFQEGLPRATIEAMNRGAACVGSSCGGIPELLPPDRIHEPGDVSRLSAIIRRLVTNPAEIVAASRADNLKAAEFDPKSLRSRRHAIYERLLREARLRGPTR